MKILIDSLCVVLVIATTLFAREEQQRSLEKNQIFDEIWLDANRMNGIVNNNGTWFYDCSRGDWGLEWPKGSGKSPVFAAGQWISALVGDSVRIASVIHSSTEFKPGLIIEPDVADDPNSPDYRWYIIRPGGEGDWSNWPIHQGAPIDENGDPLLIGDLTAFCVYNDITDHSEFGTEPLNAEVRQLAVQFNRVDPVGDMMFMKWQITNKSGQPWGKVFFSIWMDSEIGDPLDDRVGCDPNLGLAFSYNLTNYDSKYGSTPPALGVDFLQGPLVPALGEYVDIPGGRVENVKMLQMTSFIFYKCDRSTMGCMSTAREVRCFQRGLQLDASQILDPQNHPTTFMFYGNPETAEGWLDDAERLGDRRFIMSTGPFDMSPWDDLNKNELPDFGEPGVQDIVAVVMVAKGANNLNSVTKLKRLSELMQLEYLDIFRAASPAPPQKSQHDGFLGNIRVYPNPASNCPGGTGVYFDALPQNGSISIFTMSGQLIRRIENGNESIIQWDLKNTSGDPVASGIYIYHFELSNGFKTGKLAVLTYK